MTISDTLPHMMGVLHLQVYNLHGVELWRCSSDNMIVAGGYKAAVEALAGINGAQITSVAAGTNGADPHITDVEITEAVVVEVHKVEFPGEATVRFHFRLGYDVGVGMSIREFGLITGNGHLFSRKTREPIEKTPYMTIVGQWDINI